MPLILSPYAFVAELFQIPWFETPIIYDIRAKPRNIASLTGTKGGSTFPAKGVKLISSRF